ncbi:GNAT family N-acetyltransferase, partial [Bacillus cereus group sp. N15]|uniref:GNAT family N-acetyltransferase n=1 Tax=Bacillus cereus group sp. N15 TaxID=2794588 RepID=UPI0018F6480C
TNPPKLLEVWPSLDELINEGIAYSIVFDNLIVSVCFSGCVFENIHCIDIETIEGPQGRKLAQTIVHILSIIHNSPSRRLK